MKISTDISFLSYCVGGRNQMAACLELLGETPFRYADLSMYSGSAIAEPDWREWGEKVGETAERLGIKLVQSHGSGSTYEKGEYRDKCDELLRREIEICGMLGIPQIVLHALCKEGESWDQFNKANIEFCNSLLDAAEKNNVSLLLENSCHQHGNGYYYYLYAEQLLETIADMNYHPLIGVCWDVGHANMQGADQYKELVELGGCLRGLHIHDNMGSLDSHLLPYLGNCNFDSIIKALVDIDYKGYFGMEAYSLLPPGFGREGHPEKKLLNPSPQLYVGAANLMYDIAKYMLMQYNCYEE
ncbi:MAG: sugar phosphate isomerase/epimerase [Oscillospiraceae bacterium]|nr:sugar phosphate isomerase/epimerase [Oscillospiraceae bacterium]